MEKREKWGKSLKFVQKPPFPPTPTPSQKLGSKILKLGLKLSKFGPNPTDQGPKSPKLCLKDGNGNEILQMGLKAQKWD